MPIRSQNKKPSKSNSGETTTFKKNKFQMTTFPSNQIWSHGCWRNCSHISAIHQLQLSVPTATCQQVGALTALAGPWLNEPWPVGSVGCALGAFWGINSSSQWCAKNDTHNFTNTVQEQIISACDTREQLIARLKHLMWSLTNKQNLRSRRSDDYIWASLSYAAM